MKRLLVFYYVSSGVIISFCNAISYVNAQVMTYVD